MNTEPIPVLEAVRLCEMAIEDCDKATPGPWTVRDTSAGGRLLARGEETTHNPWGVQTLQMNPGGDAYFSALARSVMRPLIELVKNAVVHAVYNDEVRQGDWIYSSLAALRDHYDKTQPNWRKS